MPRVSQVLITSCTLSFAGGAASQVLNEFHKATPGDVAAVDNFGQSVAIDGGFIVASSHLDDDNGSASGSFYVFDASTGQEVRKVLADDGESGDHFGFPVAISGSVAIAGAIFDDDNGVSSGSAYLFDVTTGQQLHKLLPADGEADQFFGRSVAVAGGFALVGTNHADGNSETSGAVYVFDVATGQELFKLTADDGQAFDAFGTSVAIDGELAIIGSSGNDEAGLNAGAAYIFNLTTGQQIQKIMAPDATPQDNFGTSVALSGGLAVVGSPLDDVHGTDTGSVYVMDAATGQFLRQLAAFDAENGDNMGSHVSVSGNLVVASAILADDSGLSSGLAYVFDIATGQRHYKLLASDGEANDTFGRGVGLSGLTAVAGAIGDDDFGVGSGAMYIFALEISDCLADTNNDGDLTPADFTAWIDAFNNSLPACDQNADGSCDPADFSAWIANYNAGCG